MESEDVWVRLHKTLKKKDWAGAVGVMDAIIRSEPDHPNHYLKRGDIFQKKGDKAEAVASYLKAALYLGQAGFQKKALAVYSMVLRIDPDNKKALETSSNIVLELETRHQIKGTALRSGCMESKDAQQHLRAEPLPADNESTPLSNKEEPISSELLSLFTQHEIREVLTGARVKHYHRGTTIVREGEPGDSVFIIKSGTVSVIAHILGKEINLATLSAGDLFGEVAYLTGRPRTASVLAEDDVTVYEMNRILLDDMIEKRPEMMSQVNEIYNARVTDTIQKIKSK